MTPTVMRWLAAKVRQYDLSRATVLEVGSLDVNGSPRSLFTGPYAGIDFRPGPGVDMVIDAHAISPLVLGSYDVVVCAEMLEHDSAFWLTLANISSVLKTGGHLLLTTRGNGFKRHGHPYDYWRFMPDSGALIAALADCRLVSSTADPGKPGIFVHGIRK